jgi:hypothetical protein
VEPPNRRYAAKANEGDRTPAKTLAEQTSCPKDDKGEGDWQANQESESDNAKGRYLSVHGFIIACGSTVVSRL